MTTTEVAEAPPFGDAVTRVSILVSPPEPNAPGHKKGSAELHFEGGVMDGLKLVGFGIWEGRNGEMNVTLPSRQYGSGGSRRTFSLLRSNCDGSPDVLIRRAILAEFDRVGRR